MSSLSPLTAPAYKQPSPVAVLTGCYACGKQLEQQARFCGSCGQPVSVHPVQDPGITPVETPPPPLPTFASVALQQSSIATPALQEARDRVSLLLARERFFLIMHAALFLATNLIGFFLALKCYLEFIGDPMSKLVMATTPLVFINALSLMFLVPISGTRKQIARLKEELAYIRFQMEYGHLL